MTDVQPPADPGIRRPVEALRDLEPADGADEVATTDPATLAGLVPRSSLDATSSSAPTPAAPKVPPGGSDPYGAGTDDPHELVRQLGPRSRF